MTIGYGNDRAQDTDNFCTEEVDDIDVMVDEIIRLQERVRALERESGRPDNAFLGQLIFDAFVFIFMIFMVAKVV